MFGLNISCDYREDTRVADDFILEGNNGGAENG